MGRNRTILVATIESLALLDIRMRIFIFLATIFLIADLIADTAISHQSRLPTTLTSNSSVDMSFRGVSKLDLEHNFSRSGTASTLTTDQTASVWH